MSDAGAADEWVLVVPDDDDELLAELRRHGVRPGQRLQVRAGTASTAEGARPEPGPEEPDFIGSFDSRQPDLAERSEAILEAHFPDRR